MKKNTIKLKLMLFTVPPRTAILHAVLQKRGEGDYGKVRWEDSIGISQATVCGGISEHESFCNAFSRVIKEQIGPDICFRDLGLCGFKIVSKGITSEIFEIKRVGNEAFFISVVPYEQYLKIRLGISTGGLRLVKEADSITQIDSGRMLDSATIGMRADDLWLMHQGFKQFAQHAVTY